jgi:hypothetical protein
MTVTEVQQPRVCRTRRSEAQKSDRRSRRGANPIHPVVCGLSKRDRLILMDVDSAAKLLEATAKLVGVAIWPAAIGYILVRFGSNIGDFVSNLGEMTLTKGGWL